MYRAYFETRHFDFEAYGRTDKEALECLISGYKAHCKQYNVDIQYCNEAIEEMRQGDAGLYKVEAGECYRDRESIYKKKGKKS